MSPDFGANIAEIVSPSFSLQLLKVELMTRDLEERIRSVEIWDAKTILSTILNMRSRGSKRRIKRKLSRDLRERVMARKLLEKLSPSFAIFRSNIG